MTKKSMGSTASLCAAMLALAACSRPPPASPAPARALDDDAGFRPARAPSGITLRLDRLFYGDGETATVTVDFGDVAPPAGPVRVALSAPGARDAELVELTPGPGGRHASPPIRLAISTGDATPLDGVLSLEANTDFYALYVLDRNEPAFAGIEEDVVFDLALFEAAAPETAVHVDPRVAASDDEKDPPPGAKAVGTLVHEGGFPVQVATEELIVFPRDAAQLQAFLDLSGGTVLSSMEPSKDGEPTAYLVGLDPAPADPAQLAALRALVGETGALHASNQGALDIYFLSLFYQLEGYPVAVNPRVQRHGVPAISPQETSTIQHTMQMHPGGCMPGDPGRPCVENVPALWAFTALWDADSRRVNTAVLDFGFAPNDDFRRPSAGAFVECDMTAGGREGFQCGSGRAVGPPTVGNSFFGDKSWHGTGVVTTAGGVVNNGFGAAGVAGQVMVPMMYRYDFASYAFEMGLGMRKATDDGASCINLSGGYPCRVLTATGPDLEICSARGRARICALVHAVPSAPRRGRSTAEGGPGSARSCTRPRTRRLPRPAASWDRSPAASPACSRTRPRSPPRPPASAPWPTGTWPAPWLAARCTRTGTASRWW